MFDFLTSESLKKPFVSPSTRPEQVIAANPNIAPEDRQPPTIDLGLKNTEEQSSTTLFVEPKTTPLINNEFKGFVPPQETETPAQRFEFINVQQTINDLVAECYSPQHLLGDPLQGHKVLIYNTESPSANSNRSEIGREIETHLVSALEDLNNRLEGEFKISDDRRYDLIAFLNLNTNYSREMTRSGTNYYQNAAVVVMTIKEMRFENAMIKVLFFASQEYHTTTNTNGRELEQTIITKAVALPLSTQMPDTTFRNPDLFVNSRSSTHNGYPGLFGISHRSFITQNPLPNTENIPPITVPQLIGELQRGMTLTPNNNR